MKKILIVEDEKLLSKAIEMQLRNSDFEPIVAFDGQEGIDKAKENNPSAILLDIVMPIKDGFEVLKELKSIDNLKDIPIMILSNLGQDEEIQKGKELGAEEFFVKSDNDLDTIANKVKELTK